MSDIDPSGPPAPPAADDAERMVAWLERLRETVAELARHQVALHRELATLADVVDALRRGETPPALERRLVAADAQPRSARRLLRALLARGVGLARRVVRADVDEVTLVPDPTRALTLPDDAERAELAIDATRGAPAAWIDTALLARAAEDLAFVELRGGPHRVLVGRRSLWSDGPGIEVRATGLEALPRHEIAGRRILLDGRLPTPDAITATTRGVTLDDPPGAGHRLPRGARRRRRRITAAAGAPPAASPPGDGVAVLLTVPWSRRLEPVVAQAPQLLGLPDDSPGATSSPQVVGLAASGDAATRVAPFGDVFAPPLRAAAAVALLRAHAIGHVLHVGPGDGCFDDEMLRTALGPLEVADLPLEAFPGLDAPLARPSWLHRRLQADDLLAAHLETRREISQTTTPDANDTVDASHTARRDDARRALGLATALGPDAVVIAQIADLVPAERPDDIVELAHRAPPGWHFVLAGRGPLAGTVQDLARWRGVESLHVLSDADPHRVFDAADVVLSCAEQRPLPTTELEALARGLPLVATEVDDLTERVETLLPAARARLRTAPAGDVDALVSALSAALPQPASDRR
ncbi:MAG: glycosyltransferase [Acidobacteriota bacterium]